MSTRAQVRFATREAGISFNEHPEKIHAQFYVHSDGYPEGLGLEIAESILNDDSSYGVSGWEIEHVQDIHTDLDYIYYIWQTLSKTTWISIFKIKLDLDNLWDYKCIFVGEPQKLIEKYKLNTND